MFNVKKLSSFAELAFFENEPIPFFQTPQYLQIFAKNFCKPEDLILLGIHENEKLIGYGVFEKVGGKIVFLGMKKVLNGQEVTDYGGIFVETPASGGLSSDENQASAGSIDDGENKYAQAWFAVLNWFKENGITNVELDYVREDSTIYQIFSVRGDLQPSPRLRPASPVASQNGQTGRFPSTSSGRVVPTNKTEVSPQEVAPYIMLPNSWEEYVAGLEYHNRRELRRKMNRLEKSFFAPPAGGATEGQGFYKFVCINSQEQNIQDLKKYFAEFIRLVRLSEDEKQKFMTEKMVSFFHDLIFSCRDVACNVSTTGWKSYLNFLEIENKPVAAILTFENGIESFAYNSGYDPAYKFYSAGLLIHAFKIRDLIAHGFTKYDFLRGNERYKFDLGAKTEQLYKISINLS